MAAPRISMGFRKARRFLMRSSVDMIFAAIRLCALNLIAEMKDAIFGIIGGLPVIYL